MLYTLNALNQFIGKYQKYIKDYALSDSNWETIDNTKMKISELFKAYYEAGDEETKELLLNTTLYKSRLINDDIDVDEPYEDENGEIKTKKKTIKDFEQKIIITFSIKYYFYQLNKLSIEVAKAKNVINNRKEYKDYPDKSFKRFINNIKIIKDGQIADNCKLEFDE